MNSILKTIKISLIVISITDQLQQQIDYNHVKSKAHDLNVQVFAQPWCFESISNQIKLKHPIASTATICIVWIWLHISVRVYSTVRDSTHQ